MNKVKEYLDNKLNDAIEIIKAHNLEYEKVGIFGSYARGDYNGSSDIDIVMIFKELPPRYKTADLRWDLEPIDVDYTVLLESTFNNPKTVFQKEVVRDFKEIIL